MLHFFFFFCFVSFCYKHSNQMSESEGVISLSQTVTEENGLPPRARMRWFDGQHWKRARPHWSASWHWSQRRYIPIQQPDFGLVLWALLCRFRDRICCRRVPRESNRFKRWVWASAFMSNIKCLKVFFYEFKKEFYLVRILDTDNLLSQIPKVIECTCRSDAIHQNEAMTVLHVDITHSSELFWW